MKSLGIVRRVDDLGRIVLPKELREILNINCRDPLEIYTDNDFIILKKYQPCCIFCGESNNIRVFHHKNVCTDCIDNLHKLS